ncbi:SRPBCC family protein [Bacillus timonensis]|nr:SRPBCC family protein [Bacillus timonensis]
MNNVTKFQISKPRSEVFEAFVDPEKIGNFWFSSSSERWEQGRNITLTYDLYHAEVNIDVVEMVKDEKIVFKWGPREEEHTVTIRLTESDHHLTIIEVDEDGFIESDAELISKLLDNKEGWVYMLTCLKAYLESGVTSLRGGLLK